MKPKSRLFACFQTYAFFMQTRILTYFWIRVYPLREKLCFPVNYLALLLYEPFICQAEMIAADKRNGGPARGERRGMIGHQNEVVALIDNQRALGLGMRTPEHKYLGRRIAGHLSHQCVRHGFPTCAGV